MPLHTFTSVQPLQRLLRRIRPLGALCVPLALGAAACGGMPDTDAAVDTAVTAVTPRGFTLTLQPGVPGILPEDLTLAPAVAIATVTAADMSNTRYAVATQARFALGQAYTLTITKAGYNMTSPRFTRSAAGSEANILTMTLTVAGVEVRGRITDTEDETSIRFLGGAKATPVPLLTGTVSLTLSAGARVAGRSPAGTEKTYTSTATNITVRAEDDTTTKTYSIRVADYDANTNPYGVYTIAQLHDVRNGRTDSYRLMQNLTLPDIGADCEAPFPSQDDYCAKGFSPIGLEASPFTGTFDGNGQRIQNLAIRRSATDSVGLFGHMGASGEIRRLGVVLAAAGVTGDNAVGGLVGTSWGIVAESYAEGAVTGSGDTGGLVGHMPGGSITKSFATGTTRGSGDGIGGLVGRVHAGSVTKSYAESAVYSPGDGIGGLVGHMHAGTVADCHAKSAVSGYAPVGGLVGHMDDGTVTKSAAEGAVTGSGDGIGGLVGHMHAGTVSDCHAKSAASGRTSVGGLVGYAAGAVTDAYATGAVSGKGNNVGGLVGYAAGAVTDAYATGAVSGKGNNVGGLVGYAAGAVTDVYATGAVSGKGNNVGGLVGYATGAVTDVYATGAVSGTYYIGGLAGQARGAVTDAYATGAVSGRGDDIGGLVGQLRGTVSKSYAAGAVNGRSDIGGLVGQLHGTVSESYAVGAVSGRSYVGGLVGWAPKPNATVTHSYAVGAVAGSGARIGGLAGDIEAATVTHSYAVGAVVGGEDVGGLLGHKRSGTVTNSYFPLGRPIGADGTALSHGATASHFVDFGFANTHAAWAWVDGKWPQLKNFEVAQTTPSLTHHSAMVTTQSTSGFAIALTPPLEGLKKDDWALYKVTSSAAAAVNLSNAALESSMNGTQYTFTVNLATGTYALLYTKADVIVVPSPAGHITVTVP